MQPLKSDLAGAAKTAQVENPGDLEIRNRVRLLNGFQDNELDDFFRMGFLQEFYLNDVILAENNEDLHIYIILDGEVSLWKNDAPVMRLKTGDVFNETRIFSVKPDVTVVRAEEQLKLFKVHRDKLLGYFLSKPERLFKVFILNVVAVLLGKIDVYEHQIVRYYRMTH